MSRENSISVKMHQAQTLLTNVQQPDLKALILPKGYDDARLAEGLVLYDNAKLLMDIQKGGYANQFQSTRELNKQAADAEKVFADYVVIARRAFEEKQINDLGINGARKKSFGQWTDQAHNFYGIAINSPEIMLRLSIFGITTEIFQANQATINTLRALSITQQNMIGNAQVATERKDDALKALFLWCGDLIDTCRRAFRAEPQHLERLGKIVYSAGYKKKVKAEEPEPDQPPNEELLPMLVEGNSTPLPANMEKIRSKGGKGQK